MPTFRAAPSGGLKASIRRLIASGGTGLSPLAEVQADAAAAQTARHMSLAEKARAEVEAMQAAEAARKDPDTAYTFAGHSAGMNIDDVPRLVRHIHGVMEPNQQGTADAADNVYGDVRAPAPQLEPGQRERFQSALAAHIANRIATGKTNAQQLTAAGGNLQEQALIDRAANAPDVATGNRLVAAIHGRIREPYSTNAQGVVTNQETGAVNEGTQLAQAVRNLSAARTATEGARQTELGTRSTFNAARGTTEGAKQTELGTRSTRNTALADLARERAGAVRRGETGRGGKVVSPEQVERWVNDIARKEWETYSPSQRKGMNYEQHLTKVRERFKGQAGAAGIEQDTKDALEAINRGAPSRAVRERFRKRWGVELIDTVQDPTDSGLGAGEDALDEED